MVASNQAKIAVCPGVLRIEFNGLATLAMASSSLPCFSSALPRLLCASGCLGAISIAWRKQVTASSSFPRPASDNAEVVMGPVTPRIDFDGFVVTGDGLVEVPLVRKGIAEQEVGCGVFRVEFDGLAPAGDGLVQFALASQDNAEVVVGQRVFRVEFDGLAPVGDGLVQLALAVQVLPRRSAAASTRRRIKSSSSGLFVSIQKMARSNHF